MGMVLPVRHGQASFGADDYDVLSGTGLEQSRVLGRFLASAGIAPEAVVHGGVKGQRETATAMVSAAGWDVVPAVEEGWNEFDHLAVVARAVEGDSLDVGDRRGFQQVFEAATARWVAGGHDVEYDETWAGFVGRVGGALERACTGDGLTVVATSGGPIAAACAMLVDREAAPAELG